jgi:cytoskeletal protein RodZ
MFKFTIRDLLWLTVVVALGVAWWVERIRAERQSLRAQEATKAAESSQALSEALTRQLQNKNPAASITINVKGRSSTTSTSFGAPNPSAPATKLPKP